MYYVGIDPGTLRTGVAIKKGDKWIDSVVLTERGTDARARYLKMASDMMDWVHSTIATDAKADDASTWQAHFGIEDQYIGANIASGLTVKECAGAIAGIAYSQLCIPREHIYFINPATWQRDLLGVRPGAGMKSPEIKDATARFAAMITGAKLSDIRKDEADAICIAHYLQSVVAMGGAVDGKLLRRGAAKGSRARGRRVKTGARARMVPR